KACHDPMITKAGSECIEWNGQVRGIDSEAGQRPPRSENPQTRFESRLRAERFDCDINTSPFGDAHYFLNRIYSAKVDYVVRAQAPGHVEPRGQLVHGDDIRSTAQLGSNRSTQADRPL